MPSLCSVILVAVASACLSTQITASGSQSPNETRYNPAIPGWHSDPSCVFVPERDNTTFCTSSTFLLTPGLPIHASKDLKNWRLASHAMNRQSQFPNYDLSLAQSDGIWASTLRYHDGFFYIITMYRNNIMAPKNTILIFNSSDPYSDAAWSVPMRHVSDFIDPDIFWDTDGTTYVASAGTVLQTVDLQTGSFSEARSIWNGTTGLFLEGPHLYRKDNFYYLMVAEGGSGENHTVTIARSTDIWGPYEGFAGNPVLTNTNTSEYFQNIGHADLFSDANGQWWSAALCWRSGPEFLHYPMGRETIITPVKWDEGDWPVFTPVRGIESGWFLPESRNITGTGSFVSDPDSVDFETNSTIPAHFGYWRWPDMSAYTVSPPDHPGTLRLTPSTSSITTGFNNLTAGFDVANYTLIMRVQTDTLFQYSVDVDYAPTVLDEEAGVTVFLNQVQNINLGITLLPGNASLNGTASSTTSSTLSPAFRFLVSGLGGLEHNLPLPSSQPIPESWLKDPIRMTIVAENETSYSFYAAPSTRPFEMLALGRASSTIVSGGMGDFTGSLIGAYATSNHGKGTTPAYISRWRYQGIAQGVGNRQLIPSRFEY